MHILVLLIRSKEAMSMSINYLALHFMKIAWLTTSKPLCTHLSQRHRHQLSLIAGSLADMSLRIMSGMPHDLALHVLTWP